MKKNVDRLSPQELQDTRQIWWDERFSQFLSRHLDKKARIVLDAGCGIGTLFSRLREFFPPETSLLGADLDLSRLQLASQQNPFASFIVADLYHLPFADQTADLCLTILTLQHLEDPCRVVSELFRVTQWNGIVVAVEADNTAQTIYTPRNPYLLQQAIADFWKAVHSCYLPRDISIGAVLPRLFESHGFSIETVDGFLITRYKRQDVHAFVENARKQFLSIGRKYNIDQNHPTMIRLSDQIESLIPVYEGYRNFYTVSVVPLILVVGRKHS